LTERERKKERENMGSRGPEERRKRRNIKKGKREIKMRLVGHL